MQSATEKNVFLLISCTVKNFEKLFDSQNKTEMKNLKVPFLANEKNIFLSEVYGSNVSRKYSVNERNDYLYVLPNTILHNGNINGEKSFNISATGNHGIDLEFVSVCLSPPLQGVSESDTLSSNISDTNRSCPVRTIEAQLELLLLPTAKIDR